MSSVETTAGMGGATYHGWPSIRGVFKALNVPIQSLGRGRFQYLGGLVLSTSVLHQHEHGQRMRGVADPRAALAAVGAHETVERHVGNAARRRRLVHGVGEAPVVSDALSRIIPHGYSESLTYPNHLLITYGSELLARTGCGESRRAGPASREP